MSSKTTREQRAAERNRRRNGKAEAEQADEVLDTAELREGLKNAASAAAVGAAVGAARALGARRGRRRESADIDDDVQPEEPQDVQAPVAEAEPEQQQHEEHEEDDEDEAPLEAAPPSAIRNRVDAARSLLRDLLGTDAESVSSVHRTPHGWKVGLVVVEVRRIPDSTDVLATYDVEFDDDGGVLGIERTRRYNRSEADRGGRT